MSAPTQRSRARAWPWRLRGVPLPHKGSHAQPEMHAANIDLQSLEVIAVTAHIAPPHAAHIRQVSRRVFHPLVLLAE